MSATRKANGQFKKGHGKVHKKAHSHKRHRKNPAFGSAIRLGALGKAAGLAKAGRVARVLVVRA